MFPPEKGSEVLRTACQPGRGTRRSFDRNLIHNVLLWAERKLGKVGYYFIQHFQGHRYVRWYLHRMRQTESLIICTGNILTECNISG